MKLSDVLRGLLKNYIKESGCPTCGHGKTTLRQVSEEIGVHHTSLHRFLKGKPASQKTIDNLVEHFKVAYPTKDK